MPARRSMPGVGRISLIYTLGDNPGNHAFMDQRPDKSTALTASIGEDFADCSWPVTVKAHAATPPKRLRFYINQLKDAVGQGFYMNPRSGAGVYWRWTGFVPPGLHPEKHVPIKPAQEPTIEIAAGTGQRSGQGKGPPCGIYLLDDATRWIGDGFYGQIHGATAISGGVNEDFAQSRWPVVIKVHPDVRRLKLARYLTDLDSCVSQGLFFDAGLSQLH